MLGNEQKVSSLGVISSGGATAPVVIFKPATTLDEIEKAVILETLRHQNFNRTKAAIILGIGIRTLQRKLKRYAVLQAS